MSTNRQNDGTDSLASRAGARSVNKLSQAQLARKRQNDREAQRAIRQRTRDQIETLARQVRELSDPGNQRRLAWKIEQRNREIQQRNRELEEEIVMLKEKIDSLEMQSAGAMDAGAPLRVPMQNMQRGLRQQDLGMQWPMGMGYGGGDGSLQPGFGPGMVMPREGTGTPASVTDISTFTPSDGLISPFPPQTESPGPGFSDMDPTSRLDFSGTGVGGPGVGGPGSGAGSSDDLVLGSELASRQYFLHLQHPIVAGHTQFAFY